MSAKSTKTGKLMTQLLPWIEHYINKFLHLKTSQESYYSGLRRFVEHLEKNLKGEKHLPLLIRQKIMISYMKKIKASLTLGGATSRIQLIGHFLLYLEKNGCLRKNPLNILQKKYHSRKGLKGIFLAVTGPSPRKSLQALKPFPRFASPLGPYMQKHIALHRALGKKYREDERALCAFDRFLMSYPKPPKELSDSIVEKWLSSFSKCRRAYIYHNFASIRRFCIYLRRFDPNAYIPEPSLFPYSKSGFLPYIFSKGQICVLLKEARKLKATTRSPLRPQTIYILILLFYTTGMRLNEALKLLLSDIDWKNGTLYIREAKFGKTRLIPISKSMLRELKHFIKLRQRCAGISTASDSFLFQRPYYNRPWARGSIEDLFDAMFRSLGFKSARGHNGPRIHDFRHTFAVHRLVEWYRKGEDVQSKLILLSTYMGHVSLCSTMHYLKMTTELLQQASKRFNRYFKQPENGSKYTDIERWNGCFEDNRLLRKRNTHSLQEVMKKAIGSVE